MAAPKTAVVFGRCKMRSGEDLGKAADEVSAAPAMGRLDQESTNCGLVLEKMVPEVGLEPTRRTDPRGILSPVRLPIPPLRHHLFKRLQPSRLSGLADGVPIIGVHFA